MRKACNKCGGVEFKTYSTCDACVKELIELNELKDERIATLKETIAALEETAALRKTINTLDKS